MRGQAILVTAALLAGVACGSLLPIEVATIKACLEYALYLLVFLVGMAVSGEPWKPGEISAFAKQTLKLIVSTTVGSALGGITVGFLVLWCGHPSYLGLSELQVVIGCAAVSLGMGWYSFTGALLSIRGPLLGFLGFVSNLLREILTFIIYPLLPEGLKTSGIAIGGATTMDTTLPVICRFGGSRLFLPSFLHGFILTLVVPAILPFLVSLI